MGTLILLKNYKNISRANVSYSGSSSTYYGWIESAEMGESGVEPLITATTGETYLGIRSGSSTYSSDAIVKAGALLQEILRGMIGTTYYGTGGQNITENSYNADEIGQITSSTTTYFPNEYFKTLTITNGTASPITFDQIHQKILDRYVANSHSESPVTRQIISWVYVLDEAVTLQPNETFAVKIKIV